MAITLEALKQILKEQHEQSQAEIKQLYTKFDAELEEAKKERRKLEAELKKSNDMITSLIDQFHGQQLQVNESIKKMLNLPVARPVGVGQKSRPLIPIYDIPADSKYSPEEIDTRKKLACLFRLVDDYEWSSTIYNHITMKIPGTEYILINPFGLMYHEITASSLVKIALDGTIVDRGSTQFGINRAGYIIHTAIHEARPDIHCTIHVHHFAVAGVSAMKCGILPINQEAMVAGPVAYLDYNVGIFEQESDKEELIRIVQEDKKKKVLMLHNHGAITLGETAEEAWRLLYVIVKACETQVKSMAAGENGILIPEKRALDLAYETGSQGANNMDNNASVKAYKYGEFEWEAWMRDLDSRGFVTGHIYKAPR
uniref:Class II aldolase/adducin N-terminal domain-containing protein n=1 Tax=Acrobeloides nanus TaxID=290746 RepID=A0A914E089_9BILA